MKTYKTTLKTTLIIHFEPNDQEFTILFQNFQSLYNKQHLLEAFIDQNEEYQAICISESWLSHEKMKIINFDGYKFAASFCRQARTGGGVAILLQNHVEFIEKTDISDMSIEYVLEICATELPQENVILIVMYWNRREEDLFYKQLSNILQYINTKYHKYKIIIGGDLNVNVLINNTKTSNLLGLMLEFNFTQYIKQPTHITQNSSTCLDLLFTNFNNIQIHTEIIELGFSDHAGTVIKLKLPQLKQEKYVWNIEKRIFNSTNIEKFKSCLNNINWHTIISLDRSVNDNYKAFSETINNALQQYIPKKKIKLKTKYKKKWLTTGIKLSCKNKRLLKILTLKSNNPILSEYYKKYEKILKKTVATAKKVHFINKMKQSDNKIKAMWNVIRERSNKKQKRDKNNIKLQINNSLSSDPIEVANYFNDFFASVGQKICNTDDGKANQFCSQSVINPISNSIYLNPVDYPEIHTYIKNLKNKNSYGTDELPPSLLRQCADQLTLPLSILINQSFIIK